MVRAVEGIYRDGRVELSERPAETGPARVVVIFVSDLHQAAESRRERAAKELLADMKAGYHLGGSPYQKREDLYDRLDRG